MKIIGAESGQNTVMLFHDGDLLGLSARWFEDTANLDPAIRRVLRHLTSREPQDQDLTKFASWLECVFRDGEGTMTIGEDGQWAGSTSVVRNRNQTILMEL